MTSLPQVAPRIAKLTALSIGVALLATACGGTSTPTSTGTASANAAGIACPAPSAGAGAGTSAATNGGAVPASTGTTDTPLKIGSLLPTTGSLAFLGPPEIAGVNLGIKEINDAGGVLGKPVEVIHTCLRTAPGCGHETLRCGHIQIELTRPLRDRPRKRVLRARLDRGRIAKNVRRLLTVNGNDIV
jgi:hypothetical protein